MEQTRTIAREEIYMTTFSLVSGMYYGFGGLIGDMLGGFIYHRFSGEILFLGMGVFCGGWVVLMILYFHARVWLCKLCRNTAQVAPSSSHTVV